MNQNTNLTTANQDLTFVLPTLDISSEFSQEDLAQDTEGMTPSFPRVKVPSGGNLQFEIPTDDPDHPRYADSLVGVILCHHDSNGYWPEAARDDEDRSPLCFSVDGKQGVGDPGGLCAACGLNRFGTAEDGKGKACKNMHTLYLLQSGEVMPIMLNLPPTSLRPFKDFMNAAFMLRRRPSWASLVQLTLKRMGTGNQLYSVVSFQRLRDFAGDELAPIRAFSQAFQEQAKAAQQERVKAARERDDGCDYNGFAAPAAVIDGERCDLPD